MRALFIILITFAAPAYAQSLTPNFTTGSMTQTVTTTQTVTEVIATERYGGDVQVWNGDNINTDASGTISAGGLTFEVVDEALPWQLEVITRDAGVIETVDIERTIEIESTTNTLSVFSQ
mgnify:CR=1 FL=1